MVTKVEHNSDLGWGLALDAATQSYDTAFPIGHLFHRMSNIWPASCFKGNNKMTSGGRDLSQSW